MNHVLRCPDCYTMLVLEGGLGLVRLDDGRMMAIGTIKAHDCEPMSEVAANALADFIVHDATARGLLDD